MAVTYWAGESVTLRAIKSEDIVIFESLDDEILRNMDSLHFPRSDNKMRKWLEEQLEKDEFRFIAVDRDHNIVGMIETFECDRKMGPSIIIWLYLNHIGAKDMPKK
ncbi:hypothetical protein DALLNEIH_00999 [Bacillus sp. B01(2024)]